MDEEMRIVEDLVVPDDASFLDDIDSEYEFDAYHFFDFSKEETKYEAEEAESWFRFAHEYPPSPFIVKLKLMKAAKSNPMKAHKTSSRKTEASKKTSTSTISDAGDIDHKAVSREIKIKVKFNYFFIPFVFPCSTNSGVKDHNHIPQDNMKAKPKSTVNLFKPSGSSFMKPTASHLAKQNKECDVHSGGYGRLQKPLINVVEKLRSPIRIQNQTTKRQKLEIGYLRKAAQLKHRASFLHKVSTKAVHLESNSNSRVKTTIPKKPAFATEERAQRHMPQNKSESLQRPLNRKVGTCNKSVLDAPKLPQHKKNISQSNEFQVSFLDLEELLNTTKLAIQVQSSSVLYKQSSASPMSEDILIKRQSSGNGGKKDKCRSPNNLKSCTYDKVHPIRDGGFKLNANYNSYLPPTELFQKLSLKPEPDTKVVSSIKPPPSTKGLKENVPGSYQQEFRRCVGKPNHRGTDRRFTEVKI
ncbi:hypothetical protein SSX86_003611 [Deinandra increscens subsp. villosa]|uniref:TPX2 central domain-containing protein n=1 Tax=Deinandra increscens subsp. villosa TaxID=3103831 RepID=A0AAP0DLM3_9ASTR